MIKSGVGFISWQWRGEPSGPALEVVDVTTFWKTSIDVTKKDFPSRSSRCLLVMEAFLTSCHSETPLKSGSLPVSAAEKEEVV